MRCLQKQSKSQLVFCNKRRIHAAYDGQPVGFTPAASGEFQKDLVDFSGVLKVVISNVGDLAVFTVVDHTLLAGRCGLTLVGPSQAEIDDVRITDFSPQLIITRDSSSRPSSGGTTYTCSNSSSGGGSVTFVRDGNMTVSPNGASAIASGLRLELRVSPGTSVTTINGGSMTTSTVG